jgi:transcriptional regulator with XRE-family HTH domain
MNDLPSRQKLARTLGAAAREAREQRGLTQAEVAVRIGVAMEVYGRIERGLLLPSMQTFLSMCHVLEADPRALLGRMDPGSAPGPRQTAEDPPHVRRLTRLARELGEAEVLALLGVAKAMVELSRERRKKP